MRSIRFHTTPKGDLPRYSFIFRNPEPLGTDMKRVACSRLGTMLHLDIQKGMEAMKTSKVQKDIGGNTACMKRLAVSPKGSVQLISNNNYFVDSWFSYVKTSEEMAAAGVGYCRPTKTSHKSFV